MSKPPPFHEDPFEDQAHTPEMAEEDASASRTIGDKELVHIAGAGTIGMVLLLVSLSILFIASIAAYLLIRHQLSSEPPYIWPPPGFPHIPQTLWISTAVILCASVTIQKAINAVRRDDRRLLARYLLWTFIIGVAFLVMQVINWVEFYNAIERTAEFQGAYMGMFFVLTGLHAAHVIGGLIPLGIVYSRAGRYSRNYHPGVRYVTAYWHFLDVIWVALFLVIYF